MTSEIVLRTDDHPEANGRQPQPGEVQYRLSFNLETGERLVIAMGQAGRDDILAMLEQEQVDLDTGNTNKWPVVIWKNCYKKTPKGLLSWPSLSHPARMSYKLCAKIFEHGEAQKYWSPGDTIIDIFGGVGMTAVIGCPMGYHVILVELEQFFHDLAGGCDCTGISTEDWNANFGKWKEVAYTDGRHWCPFCLDYAYKMGADKAISGSVFGFDPTMPHHFQGNAEFLDVKYTQDYGLAFPLKGDSRYLRNVLKKLSGEPGLSGGVFSPPFGQTLSSDDPDKRGGLFRDPKRHKDTTLTGVYGKEPGQIGIMPYGAVFSPPYLTTANTPASGVAKDGTPHDPNISQHVYLGRGAPREEGNIEGLAEGLLDSLDPNKYWGACFLAYQELFAILPSGGVIAIVLRSFVKQGKIINLPNHTAELLQKVGFDIIEEARALQEEIVVEGTDLFTNEEVTRKKSTKSFFRTLQESRGAPHIDFEVVLFAKKP